MSDTDVKADLLELAADVVASYVSNNSVAQSDLPQLIADVHRALSAVASPVPAPAAEIPKPPVPIRKSVQDEVLISLEDGKPYKTLKRHLAGLGLTPESYRAKWGLPADYPMVAPAYARRRSELAKSAGLGQIRRKPAPTPEPAGEPKKKGRGRKAAE